MYKSFERNEALGAGDAKRGVSEASQLVCKANFAILHTDIYKSNIIVRSREADSTLSRRGKKGGRPMLEGGWKKNEGW